MSVRHIFFYDVKPTVFKSERCDLTTTSSHVLLLLIASEDHRNNCSAENDTKFHKHDHYWFPLKKTADRAYQSYGTDHGLLRRFIFLLFLCVAPITVGVTSSMMSNMKSYCNPYPPPQIKTPKSVEVYTN